MPISAFTLGLKMTKHNHHEEAAYTKALSAGAISIKEPLAKPWGQIVAYVRCPDGTLVEICSPVGS